MKLKEILHLLYGVVVVLGEDSKTNNDIEIVVGQWILPLSSMEIGKLLDYGDYSIVSIEGMEGDLSKHNGYGYEECLLIKIRDID